jgi:hypothetical protein
VQLQTDFLLITENAQYFNSVDGPSGIIHTEAKKLQDWGVRLIEREGAAVIEEMSDMAPAKKGAATAANGKLNIRLKKLHSPHSSAINSPRVSTPSRLNQEIKMEEDDEGEEGDESPDEYDAESAMGTDSGRGASASIDGFGTPGTRDSPESGRKYKRATGPRAPYMHKKNRPRISSVLGLLSTSTNDEESGNRPAMAPVSSTSGAVAASIPLLYGPDGSIDLPRLTEDERRALLRPAGLDDWPDMMTPYLESILPLNIEAQPNAQGLARPVKATVDGFGSAILSSPATWSSTFSYDVENLPSEQQLPPFFVSSGHVFEGYGTRPNIPLAWPRPTGMSGSASATSTNTAEYPNAPIRQTKGRDREKEREAAGAGNLDDWTYARPRLAKLIEPLDLGLYPAILPAAWINHIRSTKGGPARSRLPPFHLSTGPTFENALQDELSSLPNRVLLDGRPGVYNTNAAVSESPLDICTAIARGADQNWQASEEEQRKAGARGSDVIREVAFGGALGEAYASSVFDFVKGAAQSVFDRQSSSMPEEEIEEPSLKVKQPVAKEELRVVPSYFDDTGEMFDGDGYIGMGLIPLEVRKEAGLSSHLDRSGSAQPSPYDSVPGKNASRDSSVPLTKRQRAALTPIEERRVKMKIEDDVESNEETALPDAHLNDVASAYLSGAILGTTLCEYVRDQIISPLTSGMLDVLVAAGGEVIEIDKPKGDEGSADGAQVDGPSDRMQKDDADATTNAEVKDALIRKLTRKMLTGEYKQTTWQLTELTRAKKAVIELDSLVRTKEEMISEVTQQADEEKPLRWSSTEFDSSKVTKALEQYAQLLTSLSNHREKTGLSVKSDTLDQLRLAYIALAKLVPTKELARGQWAAWAEYLQQQMAAHQKQNAIHKD